MTRRNTRSELAVPIVFDDEVIGVINLESIELNRYAADDQEAVEFLARRIARPLADLMLRQGLIASIPTQLQFRLDAT
jgi:GAF domain-containing protein